MLVFQHHGAYGFSGDHNGVSSASSEFAVFDGVPGLDGVSSSSRSGGEHRGSLGGAVAEGLGSTLQAASMVDGGWVKRGVFGNPGKTNMEGCGTSFNMEDFRVFL